MLRSTTRPARRTAPAVPFHVRARSTADELRREAARLTAESADEAIPAVIRDIYRARAAEVLLDAEHVERMADLAVECPEMVS